MHSIELERRIGGGGFGLSHFGARMGLGRAFWVAEKTVCFIVGINFKHICKSLFCDLFGAALINKT